MPSLIAQVLSEYTFGLIPIQRLLPQDIKKPPGGLVALIVIVIVLVIIILNQLRVIRRTGWLPQMLIWYITGAVAFLLLLAIPQFTFRLHHCSELQTAQHLLTEVRVPRAHPPARNRVANKAERHLPGVCFLRCAQLCWPSALAAG